MNPQAVDLEKKLLLFQETAFAVFPFANLSEDERRGKQQKQCLISW